MNVFWGVDSKSAINFFRSAMENPVNPEKINFSGLSRFFGAGLKKWTSAFVWAGQKKNFINASSIRKITANPKIHSS